MPIPESIQAVLNDEEAALAQHAQRCLMAALDHSRANRIALLDAEGAGGAPPVLELPPKALRVFAQILGVMAKGQPIALIPQNLELSTQEAAAFLNVSRPFVVKELEAGHIPFRKVGRHRRILYTDVMAYAEKTQRQSDAALQELADQAQELNLGY